MGPSQRQNQWLAASPVMDLKQTLNVSGTDGVNVQVRVAAEDFATMPPKSGEIEGLLDACGRNPSATLRLEVPDSLSAMVAANVHPESYEPPVSSRRAATPPPAVASAKAQLGIGTVRGARPRRRQDWRIWSAPVAACGVLAFALAHAGTRGAAQAASPTHLAANAVAQIAAASPSPAAGAQLSADPGTVTAVGISFKRASRPEAAAAAPASAPVLAGRPLDLAREAARKGDNDTASQLYGRAIAEGDQPCEAWTERAALELAQGHTPAALQMYANALTTNARYVPALLGRADANWSAGNTDVAARQYADIVASVSSDLYPKRVTERAGTPAFVAPAPQAP